MRAGAPTRHPPPHRPHRGVTNGGCRDTDGAQRGKVLSYCVRGANQSDSLSPDHHHCKASVVLAEMWPGTGIQVVYAPRPAGQLCHFAR